MNNSSNGRKFLKYAGKCQSTNLLIREGYRTGRLQHADALYTDLQQAGRGQRGKLWYEEEERNLAFSILLTKFPAPFKDPLSLNFCLSVAVHEALSELIPLHIKWPNDMMVQDRKLAGILIESSMKGNELEFLVLGVGLNIGTRQFPFFVPEACSLQMLGIEEEDAATWAARLYQSIMSRFSGGSVEEIRAYYVQHLYSRGVYREFRDLRKNTFFTAAVREVDAQGRLVLQSPDGTLRAFRHGEVAWLFGGRSKEKGA